MTHLSAASYDKLQRPQASRARHRGTVDVKGLGPMETYLVPGLADGEGDAHAAPSGGFYSAGGGAGSASTLPVAPAEDSAATADATAALGRASLAGAHLRSPRGSVELHLSPAEAAAEAATANAEAAALRRQEDATK